MRALALLSAVVVLSSATPAIAQATDVQSTAPATSASSEAAALALARLTGEPVVVDSLTTETELTSAMPDGSMQLTVDATPVRVLQGDDWLPVDTELAVGPDGFFVPIAASTPVEFSPGGTTTLARIQTDTGAWLEEVSPFGMLPAPTIDGDVATYSEVLPGVDIKLTATSLGMSEVIVVKSAEAAANPKLSAVKFVLAGATVAAVPGGGVVATAHDGSTVVSSTPTWWDSSGGSTAEGPRGNVTPEPVEQSNAQTSVVLDVTAATTSRPVIYPVFIDPDWTGGVSTFWYTDKAYPTTSYLNGANAGGEQRVGYVTAAYSPDARNHTARSYWRMSTLGVNLKHVTNAVFTINETWAFNCTPSAVNLWTVNNASPGATYNQSGGYTYVGPIAGQTVAHRTGGAGACAQANVGFTATGAVAAAAASQVGYVDFAVIAGTETSNSGWKRFGQGASLTISYNSIPTVSSLFVASPARVCGTVSAPAQLNSTAGVVLQAALADVDAGSNVRGDFYLAPAANLASTTLYTAASAAVGTRSVTVPASALAEGAYAFRTRAYDGLDYSDYSAWCYFTVDNTAPAMPTSITEITAATEVGQPMQVQFVAPSTSSFAGFVYWWTIGAPTTPAPPVPVTAISPTKPTVACGASAPGGLRTACATSGTSAVLTVAPIDDESTLWVATYDQAGNVSVDGLGTSTSIGHDVLAAPDSTRVDFSQGHGWILEALTSPLAAGISDSHSGLTPLTLTQPTGYTSNATSSVFTGGSATPVFSFSGRAKNFTPTATTAAAVDPAASFTVSAWANPSTTQSPSKVYTVLSQDNWQSTFQLQINAQGRWQFCHYVCAVGPVATLGEWTYVTGIWDAANQQVRLVIGDQLNPVAVESYSGSIPTSIPVQFSVGSLLKAGNATQEWLGLIDDPTIFPGVVDVWQLSNLYYQSPPQ